jgi:membrane protein DedA with SNARE-associated domain
MTAFIDVLHSLALQHPSATAVSIFTSTIFLGEITALIASFLAWNKAISWPVLFLTLFLGVIAGNMLWYEVGRWLRGSRFGNWVAAKFKHHEIIERELQKNPQRIIFISNLVSGLSLSAMILTGWSKVPYRVFIRASIFSAAIWTVAFVVIGFLASETIGYLRASKYVKRVELLLLAFILLMLFLEYLARRSVRRKFE